MKSILDAMRAAENRKEAVLGDAPGLRWTEGPDQDRAVFSGFDLDYEELVTASHEAGIFFAVSMHDYLKRMFMGAWTDGLLTGLMLAQQADTFNLSDTEVSEDADTNP